MNYPLRLTLKTGIFASALALAAGGAFAETTVTAVMHSDLRVLDPVITTAHITRDHGYNDPTPYYALRNIEGATRKASDSTAKPVR